jgi:hypothetical protein
MMISIKKICNLILIMSVALVTSCADITDINENPNGVNPDQANPNLLLSGVMISLANDVANKGYRDPIASYMQHVQEDSWSDNNYDWSGNGWETYYSNLRNTNLAYKRAVDLKLEFHQGVAIILRGYTYGLLTDFYGDVPYSEALMGSDDLFPKYDSQEEVYKGIIADFKTAATLLSKQANQYTLIDPSQDLYYQGDPKKWMKLANSLALRYYMRLSEKEPAFAAAGVQEMLGESLISSVDDECVLRYIGISAGDSWPSNGVNTSRSDFTKIKPCTTLTYKLAELKDPRMSIWFAPVETPIKVLPVAEIPGGADDVLFDGVRYINEATLALNNQKIYNPATWYQDRLNGFTMIDTNSVYVGIPVSNQITDPYTYNLNPAAQRGGFNTHVSEMNSQFNNVSGPNLKARLFSYAEICFLKSEAALKGWGSDAEGNYNKGIKASFQAWGVEDKYDGYIDNKGVVFDGTLKMLMNQKWIASFTSASEAYFDWRRTGLPDLKPGPFSMSTVIPVRFIYDNSDRFINVENYNAALKSLEETIHTNDVPGYQGVDSPWSKPWLLQGVSKPW